MPSTHNESTERELLPCPFCDDRIAHIWSPAQGGYSVICGNGCGAEGPVMENDERAAEAWNRRATHSIQKGEVVPFKLPLKKHDEYALFDGIHCGLMDADGYRVADRIRVDVADFIISALNTHRGSK